MTQPSNPFAPRAARRGGRAALALVAAAALAGCATTKIESEWTDPQAANQHALAGAKVLVVCEATELPVKRSCEDQIAAELTALGVRPVVALELQNLPGGRQAVVDHYLPAARAAGASAVMSTSVAPAIAATGSGSSVGVGLGGFGGSGGGGVGLGVGLSLPIGGRSSPGYAASATLTEAAQGRPVWSASASAPGSTDLAAQVNQLARTLVGGAQKAGLF